MKLFNLNKSKISYLGARSSIKYQSILDRSRYYFASKYVKGKTVLDIASGTGWGSFYLAQSGAKEITAIDICQLAIDGAKKNYNHKKINYICGSEKNIPNKKFDIIICFETIEHVNNPIQFLKIIKECAKNNTILIISTPNKMCHGHLNGKPWNPFHFQEYSYKEIKKIIIAANWKILEKYGQFFLQSNKISIREYKNFNQRYWKIIRMRIISKIMGFFYFIFITKFNKDSKDPALKNPVVTKWIKKESPVYFVFKCKGQTL